MNDGKLDGKFIIQRGDSITKGIAKELGLSKQECKQIGSSVWAEIIKEFENPENMDVHGNGGKNPNLKNNYLVRENAVVTFSKECWSRIVNLINIALGKNIQVEDIEDVEDIENPTVEENALDEEVENTKQPIEEAKKLPVPQRIPASEIDKITMLNTGEYRDEVVQMSDGKFYEFDSKGQVTRIYKEPKKESINNTQNSFTYITYREDGIVERYYKYENEGEITDDKRVCGIYNDLGELEEYYIDSEFDAVSGGERFQDTYDKNGLLIQKAILNYDTNGKKISQSIDEYDNGLLTCKAIEHYDTNGKEIYCGVYKNLQTISITEKIHDKLSAFTPDTLSEMLSEIGLMNLSEPDDSDEKESILYLMSAYEDMYDKSLLEALEEMPNGKELTKTLIDHVKELCEVYFKEENSETYYKYTDDIEADMASHPTDYKKLSIDLKRMLNRAWLLESENKKGEYGDNKLKINGVIDKKQNVQQKGTGNCYLISSVIALSQKTMGAKAIKEMITKNKDGSVTVTFKGANKSYTISKEEILDSDHLSAGDDDMRVIEIAFDKYRRDLAYESEGYLKEYDSYGGFLTDVTQAIFGKDAERIEAENFDVEKFNDDNLVYTFSFEKNDKCNTSEIKVKNAATGKFVDEKMDYNHAYAIIKSDNEYVYFVNPWDKNELLQMEITEFKNLNSLNLSQFNLA